MDIDLVRAEVERRFAASEPRRWPPPREPMAAPLDVEYSRVTDPAKYRIVVQRGAAWAEAAAALLAASYEEIPVPTGDDAPTSWRAPLASSHRLASPAAPAAGRRRSSAAADASPGPSGGRAQRGCDASSAPPSSARTTTRP